MKNVTSCDDVGRPGWRLVQWEVLCFLSCHSNTFSAKKGGNLLMRCLRASPSPTSGTPCVPPENPNGHFENLQSKSPPVWGTSGCPRCPHFSVPLHAHSVLLAMQIQTQTSLLSHSNMNYHIKFISLWRSGLREDSKICLFFPASEQSLDNMFQYLSHLKTKSDQLSTFA